jgi:hypothetical protein
MKMKVDLSKFKLKSKDDKIATLIHPDGHEFRVAINALHPMNRKHLEALSPHVEDVPVPAEGQTNTPNTATGNFAKGGEAKTIEKKEAEQVEDYKPMEADKNEAPAQHYAEGGEATSDSSDSVSDKDDSGDTGNQSPVTVNVNPPAPGAGPQGVVQPQAAAAPAADTQQSVPTQSQQNPVPNQAQPGAPTPDVMSGYQKQVAGITGEAQAQAAQAQAQSNALKAKATAALDLKTKYQNHFDELDKERKSLQDDILNQRINPNHYMSSLNTGHRIATGIGLFLGGMGSGLTHSPNQALEFLNKNIDRDIQAQQTELGKKETLLSANLKQFGNLHDATEMTRVMMNDASAAQLQRAALSSQSPLVKARAQQMLGQLEMQSAPIIQQMAMRKTLMSITSGNQPGGLGQQDPAQFVPYVVPNEHQAKVFGEIEAAQNTKHMSGDIMNAFDQATEENTVLKTGAGLVRTPASVYALHQALQPTFKDLEGTVRQAAMDNTFKNVTPAPGDSQHTIDTKRAALAEYLKSKASAPTAKGYGIDLDKFQSTTTQTPQADTMKVMNGATYRKVPGGWQKVQ